MAKTTRDSSRGGRIRLAWGEALFDGIGGGSCAVFVKELVADGRTAARHGGIIEQLSHAAGQRLR